MTTADRDETPERRRIALTGCVERLAPGDRAWVSERGAAAIERLGSAGEVRVRLVGDAEMASAHERHCGVPGTTDVITFDLTDGASARGAALDVDLLVCVDEAERQARTRGHALRSEVLLYLVHGVLHCLGHDDHAEDEAAAMHAREDEVLRAIGVGATYASGEAGS
jgi:probable rRNA maturation factor